MVLHKLSGVEEMMDKREQVIHKNITKVVKQLEHKVEQCLLPGLVKKEIMQDLVEIDEINKKLSQLDSGLLNKENKMVDGAASVEFVNSETVSKMIKEAEEERKEATKRMNNIVIYNCPESNTNLREQRLKDDTGMFMR